MKVVLGIDGGGTRTRAVLVSEKGEILGAGQAGPGNPYAAGHEEACKSVNEAVTSAWKDAGQPQRPADAAFLGLAGVRSPEIAKIVQQWAADLNLAPPEAMQVDSDLRIALAGGLGNAPGLVLAAGTGSACCGRSGDGRTWQAGGWGWKFDDPGSAYWLGVQAMAAAARANDGRGPTTTLEQIVTDAFQLKELRGLTEKIYEPEFPREKIASLAPLVIEAAASGDKVAHAIIQTGCDELTLMAAAVANKLGLENQAIDITTTGAALRPGEHYYNTLQKTLTKKLPHARLQTPRLPPVLGASLLALETLGLEITKSLLEKLETEEAAALLIETLH